MREDLSCARLPGSLRAGAGHAERWVHHPGLLQMLLIAAQRSGQADLVRGTAEQIPRITQQVPWERTLLNVTLGETDPDQALSLAADNEQRAQVLFYAAARLITLGQAALAPDLLWRSLALYSRGFESVLATGELTWIEQAAPRTAP